MPTPPSSPTPAAQAPHPFRVLMGHTRGNTVPPGTHALGMWLFLAALTMLFLAGLLAYILIRIMGTFDYTAPTGEVVPATAPPLHTLQMPIVLWLSTAAILLSSYTLHRAVENIRRERQDKFRQALTATLVLAAPFFLAQLFGLGLMLKGNGDITAGGTPALYRTIVFLVVVHALHLVGGLIPLAVVTKRAHAGRYDHEYYTPVANLARYWHFLDLVWITMFGTFLVLG
ncbi:MAG: heme-copper oxidase subunit III [Phycisphaerales bacterium JB063]